MIMMHKTDLDLATLCVTGEDADVTHTNTNQNLAFCAHNSRIHCFISFSTHRFQYIATRQQRQDKKGNRQTMEEKRKINGNRFMSIQRRDQEGSGEMRIAVDDRGSEMSWASESSAFTSNTGRRRRRTRRKRGMVHNHGTLLKTAPRKRLSLTADVETREPKDKSPEMRFVQRVSKRAGGVVRDLLHVSFVEPYEQVRLSLVDARTAMREL